MAERDSAQISIPEVLIILIRWRRFVAVVVFSSIVIASLVVLIIPPVYRVEVIVLPRIDDAMPIALEGAGGIAAIGSISSSHMNLPFMTSYADVYARILRSDHLTARVVDSLSLADEFGVETTEDAMDELKRHVVVEVGLDGTVRITSRYKSASLAHRIALQFFNELNSILQEVEGRRQRKIETFLDEQKARLERELQVAEDSLAAFQSQHGMISLSEQTLALVNAQAAIESQITETRVTIGVANRAYGDDSPLVSSLQTKLDELIKQLNELVFSSRTDMSFARLPEVAADYTRLLRKVQRLTLSIEPISSLYERSRMMSERDVQTVFGLLPSEPPTSPEKRRVLLYAWVSLAASFMLMIAVIVIVEGYKRFRDTHPEKAHELEAAFRKPIAGSRPSEGMKA